MLWSYPLQDQTARPTTAYTSRFWSAWPIPPSGAPDRPRAATETNHCSENGSLRGGVLVFRMETDVPPWRRFYTVNPAAGPRTFPTPRPCLREPSRGLPDTPTRPRFGTSLPHHASEPRPTTCPLIPRTLPLGPDLSRAPFPASQAQRSPSPSGHPCPRAPAAPCRGPWALRWGRSAGGALRGAVGGGFWHFLGAANGLTLDSENGNVCDGAAPHPLPPSSSPPRP